MLETGEGMCVVTIKSIMSNSSIIGGSPTTIYAGPPPPPYSYSPSTASSAPASAPHHHLISPAASRRTSGDEKESLPLPPPPPSRQSLPSIHEALKQAPSSSYAPAVSTTTVSSPRPAVVVDDAGAAHAAVPAVAHAHVHVHTHAHAHAHHPPPDASLRERPIDSSPPPPPPQQSSMPYPTQTAHPGPTQSHAPPGYAPPGDTRRISLPSIVPQDPRLPPLRTGPSTLPPTVGAPTSSSASSSSLPPPPPPPPPPASSLSSHPEHPSLHPPPFSPRHDRTPTSAGSMNHPFSYSHYHQPQYLQPPLPPTASQPLYPSAFASYSIPHAPAHPPAYAPPAFAEREAPRPPDPQPSYPAYRAGENHGTSVKRHLEYFDVEASLKQVTDSSVRLAEFSRDYSHRTRNIQRTGPLPGILPSIAECDDMMQHQQLIQDLLGRLREMLVSEQNAVMNRHAQERPFKGAAGEFEIEDPSGTADDGKTNGSLGADARKRRGRAAPPGRCHSCNRAETPEWRRGPDGARTLCNACGLHYAKLTRKQGPKTSLGGSSLRPKPMGTGQPPP